MLRPLIKLAVSALLIYLLLRNRDLGALTGHLLAVDRTDLILAALCYATVALPSALRWSIVIGSMGYRLEFRRALSLMLIGYFFNLTIVSSIGGDGVRMWMAHRANLSPRVAVSSVVIERLAQLFAHLLILAATLPLLFYRVQDVTMRAGAVLIVVFGAFGFAVLLTLDRLPAAFIDFRAIRALAQFAQDLRNVLLVPRLAAPTIALGFVNQITIICVIALLAEGLRLPIGFADCLVVVPAALLLTALPVTISGWGIREGAFAVGFGYLGVSSNGAITLSILFGLLNTIVRLPGGLLWLFTNDRPPAGKLPPPLS